MIYITQLIYLKPGQEAVFEAFESHAIPVIGKYNGEFLLRLRPGPDAVIENSMEVPYEVHLVRFPAMQDFEGFKRDEERKRFLHLKEQSIRTVLMIQGEEVG